MIYSKGVIHPIQRNDGRLETNDKRYRHADHGDYSSSYLEALTKHTTLLLLF